MPYEQINFRRTVDPLTGVVLRYELTRKGRLSSGFVHFPSGCNGLVYVRVLITSKKQYIKQVCPIGDEYIALDDANYPFHIDQPVEAGDLIFVEIYNHDATYQHTISTIITFEYPVRKIIRRVIRAAPNSS